LVGLFFLHPPDIMRKIDCSFLLVMPSVSPQKQGVPEIIGPQLHLGQVLISRMASSSAITLLSNRTQYDDFTIEGVHHMHCRGHMENIQQLGLQSLQPNYTLYTLG
jgi:hypothetical protein